MRESTVRIPAWESANSLEANIETNLEVIDDAIRAPQMVDLLETWQLTSPTDRSDEMLDWLAGVADEYWDFRKGRERNQVGEVEFTQDQTCAIDAASAVLGLQTPTIPARSYYDVAFVLGGLLRGCLTRWRMAQELMRNGVDMGWVVGLGGTRMLTPPEEEQGCVLGIGATTEFDAMVQALRLTFHPQCHCEYESHEEPELPNANWAVMRYDSTTPRLAVVAAPSSEPESRRANTADTIEWWLQRIGVVPGQSNLLITSQIYVPYQASVAVRTLGLTQNTTVEFAGVTPSAGDLGEVTQKFQCHHYLQEIGSTIRGYHQLRKALVKAQGRL